MERIDSISPEHEARFPEWVDKWVSVGLNIDRVDKEIAGKSILDLYDAIEVPRPSVCLSMDSPNAAAVGGAYAVIQLAGLEDGLTYNECRDRITDVDNVLFEIVAAQVTKQIGKDFPSEPNHVSKPDLNKVTIADENVTSNFYGGSFYVSWLSFVTFLRDVMGWENEILAIIPTYEALCRNANAVWWHEDVVAFSDNPLYIKFDDQERLHGENCPAIEYADGWKVYSWHGTRVPSEWIEDPSSLTPEIALTWEDIEQRRCACEILGWHNILDRLDAKVIDDDGDPEIGVLIEVDLPDVGKEKFLKVQCGTGRTFALPVPPEMETALEAQSWTWGIDQSEFIKPEIRT